MASARQACPCKLQVEHWASTKTSLPGLVVRGQSFNPHNMPSRRGDKPFGCHGSNFCCSVGHVGQDCARASAAASAGLGDCSMSAGLCLHKVLTPRPCLAGMCHSAVDLCSGIRETAMGCRPTRSHTIVPRSRPLSGKIGISRLTSSGTAGAWVGLPRTPDRFFPIFAP